MFARFAVTLFVRLAEVTGATSCPSPTDVDAAVSRLLPDAPPRRVHLERSSELLTLELRDAEGAALAQRSLPVRSDCAAAAPLPAMDLRGLQPPEPIVRILQALERSPREPLRVILPHEPVPLYALLRERGFTCSGAQRPDGGYELLIERS